MGRAANRPHDHRMHIGLFIPLILVMTACGSEPGLGGPGSTTGGPGETDSGDDTDPGVPTTSASDASDSTGAPDDATTGTSEPVEAGGWSIRDRDPYGRSGHAAILDEAGERMIVYGGGANDTWVLPLSGPHADEWSQLSVAGELPPVHAYGTSLFSDSAVYDPLGQRMIVLLNPTPVTASDHDEVELWELALTGTPKWRRLVTAGPGPGAEVQSGRVVLDRDANRLFIVGGALDHTGVWSLSLTDPPTWERFADTPPEANGSFYVDHSLLFDAARGQLVLFGGWPRLQRIWGLSLATRAWTLLDEGDLASGSYGATAALDAVHDRIVIFGGDQIDSVHTFSLATHAWTATNAGNAENWPLGASAAVDAARGRVLYFSGVTMRPDSEQEAVNTTWSLGFADLELAELLPATRRGEFAMAERRAIWDPSREMVVAFGGHQGGETWTHGLALADAWTPAVVGAAPSLANMAAIYDEVGQAIVSFGGRAYSDSNVLMRLASDPGAVWETLAVDGGPSARSQHVAVYDAEQRRMIVHGGRASSGDLPQPLADTWALTLDGEPAWTQLVADGPQPAARGAHVAIHDPQGQRMIVYGGVSEGDQALVDLWSLSLADAPTWTKIWAPGPSPQGLLRGSAVYDPEGQRMILVDLARTADPPGARVFALELGEAPTWHRFCAAGLTPAELWVSPGTATNVVLVDDGLFLTVSGGAFRFDLQTAYCD